MYESVFKALPYMNALELVLQKAPVIDRRDLRKIMLVLEFFDELLI